VASFAYGWFVYWRSGVVAPDPFVLAAICVLSAAGVQAFRELWARVRR
jgi:hypothetical protein